LPSYSNRCRVFFASAELRIPSHELRYEVVAERLLNAFGGAPVTSLDGFRLAVDSGIVLARPSSTEPAVSLRVEGADDGSYERCLSAVLSCAPEVRFPPLESTAKKF
jgi:phosphomannomutase